MAPDRPGAIADRRHRRRCCRKRIAIALAMTVGASGMSLGIFAASSIVAPNAGAATSCSEARISATIHFGVALRHFTDAPMTDVVVVKDVVVSGLPSACEGARVKVLLEGNSAGQVAAPAHLLSMADSTVDPCTQSKLATPLTVGKGSITLDLCSTPGTTGSDVSAHDLTLVTLFVNTVKVSITPVTSPASGGGSGAGPGSGPPAAPVASTVGTGLAFTGAEIAITIAAGVALFLAGLVLAVLDRLRRRHAGTGEGTS